jgi:hypothetical protein
MLALACRAPRDDGSAPHAKPHTFGQEPPAAEPANEKRDGPSESAHDVVFADRTSHAYLLLVEGKKPPAPSRDELKALVRKRLDPAEAEVDLLLALIDMDPERPQVDPVETNLGAEAMSRASRQQSDLLGLYIDVLPLLSADDEAIIPIEALTDPILTRELEPAELESLASRKFALLLRADYRNQHDVRGLRLLQTLVRLVARTRGALIHDPDTRETVNLETFTHRRLRKALGNVADQVVVVPFSDPRHGDGYVRLATRGMRRFGSVDLELDGLPRDPELLQQATHLIYGLAARMVRLGEVDVSGLAVQLDDTVTIRYEDIVEAYASRAVEVPRCRKCPEEVAVHLVEREKEGHDPRDHVVARIVAPRSRSDRKDYDQTSWAREAIHRVLGPSEL